MNCDWRAHTTWWYNGSLFFFPTTLPNPLAEPPAFWRDRTWTSLKKRSNLLLRTICRVKNASSCHLQISSHVRGYECDNFRDIFSPHSSFLVQILMDERGLSEEPGSWFPRKGPLREQVCPWWKLLLSTKHPFSKKTKEFWGGHKK